MPRLSRLSHLPRHTTLATVLALGITAALVACGGSSSDPVAAVPPVDDSAQPARTPLRGQALSRAIMPNPHSHIPAQCYIETSHGTQNACLFCHSDGVAELELGNNNPQAGLNPNIGNLQADYAFGVIDYPYVVNASINPWLNTLKPEELRRAVDATGQIPEQWDMQTWLRSDNWSAAYARRPVATNEWDTGIDSPFRLFPALAPADLPAQADGYVRSATSERGLFTDAHGHNTGWRAINFMPYGIFTPLAGSVSGIYIRLPQRYMQDAHGAFDLTTYNANLDRVARNVQDRLASGETHYLGAAAEVEIVRGQYPLGTEFAHPLHYVDVEVAGTRAQRVKEVRWMYKRHPWYPHEFGMGLKDESAPVHANITQGWIDNGSGWLLGGWIEDAQGELRPQTASELVQCVGCHSGNTRQPEIGQTAMYTAGTGNTVDATWAMPRQFAGARGWREMDYLDYRPTSGAAADATPGTLHTPEPHNRANGRGEWAFFLDHVVGASLFGDMPASVDAFLAREITTANGYAQDWPSLEAAIARHDAAAVTHVQRTRQQLIRAFTARNGHLDAHGAIRAELLLPPRADALEGARRYRQVVATQRYDFGKDVFPATPFTLRYFRTPDVAYTHQDGRPYQVGEVITDRPINETVGDFTYGMGIVTTLIDEELPFSQGGTFVRDWVPLLKAEE